MTFSDVISFYMNARFHVVTFRTFSSPSRYV